MTSSYGRAIINFIRQALVGQSLPVFGDGKQTRSFCYVTDTVTGLLKFLLADEINGEIVNIGNQNEVSITGLASKIISMTNSESKILFKPLPEDDPLRRLPDISKAGRLFGFNPTVSLDDGLKRTIEWAKEDLQIPR